MYKKIIIRTYAKYNGKTQCPSVEVEGDGGEGYDFCESCAKAEYDLFVEFQNSVFAWAFAWLLKMSETYGNFQIIHRRCLKL